jgi:hypothetical protein
LDDSRQAIEPTVKHEDFTDARFDRHTIGFLQSRSSGLFMALEPSGDFAKTKVSLEFSANPRC